MTTAVRNIIVDVQGQGLAEYGLILGLIAIACIAAVVFLSGNISALLSNVGSSVISTGEPDPVTVGVRWGSGCIAAGPSFAGLALEARCDLLHRR